MQIKIIHHLLYINGLIILAPKSSKTDSIPDFPPLLDADDIAYFSENHDMDGLHWALSNVFRRSQRNTDPSQIVFPTLPPELVNKGGGTTYTTAYKLKLDLEQAHYLSSSSTSSSSISDEKRLFFQNYVITTYQSVLDHIPPLENLKKTEGLYPFQKQDYDLGIGNIYNKALHITDFDELRDDDGNLIPLLSDSVNTQHVENQWFNDPENPGVVVIDNVLSSVALSKIRQLLLESTVWYQTKMPLKFGGYVGAYIDDGLYDRILLQLAFEINQAFPRIMHGHPLRYLWAYKYDSEYTGINTHADQAAVNVNLWITPDDANLDKNSGGLVIFTAKPPSDWDFERFNTDTERVMEDILKPTNFRNVTVPYRENRAVMFDSALFHHTDTFKFKDGYENRRINLTLLYGYMNTDEHATVNSNKSEL